MFASDYMLIGYVLLSYIAMFPLLYRLLDIGSIFQYKEWGILIPFAVWWAMSPILFLMVLIICVFKGYGSFYQELS
jgi:hypothetical protein